LTSLRVLAPAKINLGLRVGDRRPDGYHDIVTVIVPLDLADELHIEPAKSGIRVSVTNAGDVPEGPANLVWQAARAFFDSSGINAGCRIRIHKRVPTGAGLGGGSSDAAATLHGLNRLFNHPLSRPHLGRIAAGIGSDVPARLADGPTVARGRGERIRRIRLPRLTVILHLPGFPVATKWAYRRLDVLRHAPGALTNPEVSPKILALRLRRHESARVAHLLWNSFEPVVFKRHPELADAKRLLLDSGCYAAALSGSGSTVYGLVDEHGSHDPMAAMARTGLPCVLTHSA
jgi:4-diphosphocytidyl-2-C-methyl-D-erythritol kinase